MMCQYVIMTSISEHVTAQLYLKDAVRLYNFTFYLQIIGITVTIVCNLWNASADVTIMKWIKEKGWLDRKDESFCDFYFGCNKSAPEGDQVTHSASETSRVDSNSAADVPMPSIPASNTKSVASIQEKKKLKSANSWIKNNKTDS